MTQEQRQYLMDHPRKTISIGITEQGLPRSSTSVPWIAGIHAYSMHTPDIYLAPEDLHDPAVIQRLSQLEVIGCYIYLPLPDYRFLADFPHLRDISIRFGTGITDISFMFGLKNWRMFYLEDAKLEDLEALFPPDHQLRNLHCLCIGLLNCQVRDIGAVARNAQRLGELVIYQPQGTGEGHRWESIPLRHKYYYEYKET